MTGHSFRAPSDSFAAIQPTRELHFEHSIEGSTRELEKLQAASTDRPAAQQAFDTDPGFAVDLAAAEPLTIDPVALAFDQQGRLFVAENRDYPVGAPNGEPLGIIEMVRTGQVAMRRGDAATA